MKNKITRFVIVVLSHRGFIDCADIQFIQYDKQVILHKNFVV